MHRDLCEAAGKTNITVQKRDRSRRGSRERERKGERDRKRERERAQKSLMYDVANCLK